MYQGGVMRNMELLQSLENSYIYNLYGLIVSSELNINELVSVNNSKVNEVDVFVKFENMPQYILKRIEEGRHSKFSKEESFFVAKDIAIYRIINGNTIYIQSIGGTEKEIKCYLLGTAFSTLLIQRNIVPIHGGSIVVNNKAFTIVGDSGAGKSTLISGFRLAGYKFLCDDLSRVKIEEDKVKICSAYPQQKLCRDAILEFNLNINELVMLDEARDKFAVPSKESFIEGECELYGIIEIIKDPNISEVKLEEVKGVSKINSITNNTYTKEIVGFMGRSNEFLKNVLNIASKVKVYKLYRPSEGFTIKNQINSILSEANTVK